MYLQRLEYMYLHGTTATYGETCLEGLYTSCNVKQGKLVFCLDRSAFDGNPFIKFAHTDFPQSIPGQGVDCPVCYEKLEAAYCVRKQRCGHQFCNECVSKWLMDNDRSRYCPYCHDPIQDENSDDGKSMRCDSDDEIDYQESDMEDGSTDRRLNQGADTYVSLPGTFGQHFFTLLCLFACWYFLFDII
jgi:predicted GNAT family acetyltransferase